MATVYQEFQSAPMGRRVVGKACLVSAIILAGFGVSVFVAFGKLPPEKTAMEVMAVAGVPLVGVVVAAGTFLRERSTVASFRIEDNVLVLGRKRYPMAGIVDIGRNPEVMRRAARVWANGGFGAIRGHFWSKKVGKFYAFMTGTENAVVLRWPDKTVAVSPVDPEFFIYTARAAAGMR
jgi:hypothetical protein